VPLKARDVESALKSKGFKEVPKRDHKYFFLYHNGKKTPIRTKISHGESEIRDKNCSSMARQIKLTGSQFNDFVDCPLSLEGYLKILVDGKHLAQTSSS
jgi:predicted RNA binding protein YcfA (HicA-like mRNA interferase family)